MRKNREQGKWSFGLLWVIVNTLGWGLNILLAPAAGWIVWQSSQYLGGPLCNPLGDELNSTLLTMIVLGLSTGGIIGGFQLLILARRFELKEKNWVLANMVGMTLYVTIPFLWSWFFDGFLGFAYSFPLIGTFVRLAFSFAPPLILGLAQQAIL